MRLIECVAVATVLFVAACSITSIFPSVKAASNLVILSSSMFTDTEFQYPSNVTVTHVVGEIQNTGDAPAISSDINATFYDASNAVLPPQNSYDLGSETMSLGGSSSIVMLPGAKVPFDVQLTGSLVDHYTLSVSDRGYNASRDDKPQMLQILSRNFYVGQTLLGQPARIVNGTVKNTGAVDSVGVWVFVTFYDTNGTVVERNFDTVMGLNAGATGTFEVQVYRAQQQFPNIAFYRVTAQSPEYTVVSEESVIVPEFAVVLAPLLLLAAMTAIFVFYRKGRLKSSNNNTP